MTDGLIELGERDELARVGQPRVLPRHQWRRILVGVVAIAVLLGVAGSAGRPPRLSDLIWSAQRVSEFVFGERTLYTVQSASVVQAREPESGAIRWSLPVPGAVAVVEVSPAAVAIIIPPDPGASTQPPATPEVSSAPDQEPRFILVDIASGHVFSRTVGQLWSFPGGAVLLVRSVAACSRTTSCQTLVGLNPATGADLWQVRVPDQAQFGADDIGQRLVTIDEAAGRVEMRSSATGEVLAVVALPAGYHDALVTDRSVSVVGDAVLVGYGHDGDVLVEAHPLAPSGRAWSARVPGHSARVAQYFGFYAGPCAGLLCLEVDGATTILDPATGAIRGQVASVVIGGYGVNRGEPNTETMVALGFGAAGPGPQSTVQVLRVSDVAVLATIDSAAVVYWTNAHGRWLIAQERPGSTAFTVVDRRGQARPIGSISGEAQQCVAAGRALVCGTHSGDLRLWRLPSPAELTAGIGDARP